MLDDIEIRTVVREVLVPAERSKRWPILAVGSIIGSLLTVGIYVIVTWIW